MTKIPEKFRQQSPKKCTRSALAKTTVRLRYRLLSTIRHAPTPEILVKIGAAGVNRGDCYQRMGFIRHRLAHRKLWGWNLPERSWPAGRASRAGSPARALPVWWPAVAMPNTGSCMKTTRSKYRKYEFYRAAALPETIYTVWANVLNWAGWSPAKHSHPWRLQWHWHNRNSNGKIFRYKGRHHSRDR